MGTFSETFSHHHKHCDEVYAQAEEAAAAGDWPRAATGFDAFRTALLAHFGAEEDALFPAFEAKTGMQGGPPAVMRLEHGQMRQLLEDLGRAVAAKDADAFLGGCETLLILMQQHNLKEENILYPLCDNALGDDAALVADVRARLGA
jgi:iron-sulfur cluster repair protein YtfE (RIC family)